MTVGVDHVDVNAGVTRHPRSVGDGATVEAGNDRVEIVHGCDRERECVDSSQRAGTRRVEAKHQAHGAVGMDQGRLASGVSGVARRHEAERGRVPLGAALHIRHRRRHVTQARHLADGPVVLNDDALADHRAGEIADVRLVPLVDDVAPGRGGRREVHHCDGVEVAFASVGRRRRIGR